MKQIKSILMVDDNEGDHIIAEVAIKQYDSSIVIHKAYDGREALDLLKQMDSPPDVIFLDINMPGMDGHEFLSEYDKTSHDASVVVMLSTSDQDADKEKCLAYSFVKEYITKPLEGSDIEKLSESL